MTPSPDAHTITAIYEEDISNIPHRAAGIEFLLHSVGRQIAQHNRDRPEGSPFDGPVKVTVTVEPTTTPPAHRRHEITRSEP